MRIAKIYDAKEVMVVEKCSGEQMDVNKWAMLNTRLCFVDIDSVIVTDNAVIVLDECGYYEYLDTDEFELLLKV